MSIPLSITSNTRAVGIDDGNVGTDKVKNTGASAEMRPAEKAQLQLNAAILQASSNVAIGSQNDPLALIYKSAITSINEKLQAEFGPDALQNASSQDNTPDGTADRIVSLSTGFFDAFKKQHPNDDPDVVLGKFMDTIRKGFESGFKEASNILKGLDVLKGGVASNIEKTYALVQQGYAAFEAAHSSKASTDV